MIDIIPLAGPTLMCIAVCGYAMITILRIKRARRKRAQSYSGYAAITPLSVYDAAEFSIGNANVIITAARSQAHARPDVSRERQHGSSRKDSLYTVSG
jgi:hypothetical protein